MEKAEVPAAEDGSAAVERVKMRFSRRGCDAVRESLGSLHRAVRAGVAACGEERHEAGIELDWEAVPRFTVFLMHGQDDAWRCFHASGESKATNGHAQPLLKAPSVDSRSLSPRRLKLARMLSRSKKSVTIITPNSKYMLFESSFATACLRAIH